MTEEEEEKQPKVAPHEAEKENEDGKTGKKYRKILLLFRSGQKESEKSKLPRTKQKKKKEKKKECSASDERKEQLKKNMENSWTELPNTLKRKKEKISEELLGQYHDAEANSAADLNTLKSGPSDQFLKNTFERDRYKPGFLNIRNYILGNSPDGFRDTCDFFRSKCEKEDETKDCPNRKTETVSDDKLMENGQLSLEKIRKLAEDDYEMSEKPKNVQEDRKETETEDNDASLIVPLDIEQSPPEEVKIESLLYDIVKDDGHFYQNSKRDCSESFKSDKSDTYVSKSIIFETHPIVHAEDADPDVVPLEDKEKEKEVEEEEEERAEETEEKNESIERCASSDSLLNSSSVSSCSASEVSHHDDSGTDVACEDAPSKPFKEMISNFEKIGQNPEPVKKKGKKLKWNSDIVCGTASDITEAISKLNKVSKQTTDEKQPTETETDKKKHVTHQYSDIVFNTNESEDGEDSNKQTKQNEYQIVTDHKIVYQEVNFPSGNGIYEEVAQLPSKHIYEEPNFIKTLNELDTCLDEETAHKKKLQNETSHMTEEERAKKKSAEAIAKELSTQIFAKRKSENSEAEVNRFDKHRKEFLKSLGYELNPTNPTNGAVVDTVKKTLVSEYLPMKPSKKVFTDVKDELELESSLEEILACLDASTDMGKEKEEEAEEMTYEKERKEEPCCDLFCADLQYFSVADWRKAVAMGSKRGINSMAMETIVEEPETDTATKLTVREILRRFEELGSRQFSEKFFMTDEERTATLKQIHETLKCLEEKVRSFECKSDSKKSQQSVDNTRTEPSSGGWTGRRVQRISQTGRGIDDEETITSSIHDGKHSLLQFAIHHFRQSPEKFEMLKTSDGSISGSLKVIESKNKKNKEKGKGSGKDPSEWTWKEQVDLVKFTPKPIEQSLLRLDTAELSELAVECFVCLMRYMGDLPMPTDVSEVKCVYTILMHCHKFEQLCDEVYCQLMKQTTNNKSVQQESCQRGWRLFSIVAAYFICSDTLKPFLFKYLETAAYDKRRAYHGTATVCLQNLRKTFKYGGRKNVPSVEEITAISAGRNSKRQIYRLPGGTEKVVNTKSTTVVQDVIEELCIMINVTNPQEMEEFSVYCIVEGDTFTMPLAREEYILDVTTELHKNHQVFYLIFCRSVWYFPLRLDSQLYVEVVFNQIAPDYLEGLLLVLPGETLEQEVIYDIAKIAALLHRAADMTHLPSMKETKFLLPKPALSVREVKPSQWVNMVQSNWQDTENLTALQAKAQVLDVLSKWPLFGSSFFAVKKASEQSERTDHILALNRNGVHFIDLTTHETLLHYPFSEVISTRKVKSEDGTLFLDMKCGNLMQQRITRLQTDQAHEISRLIRQYITMQQRMAMNPM